MRLPMTTASRCISELQRERRDGNLSSKTEQHLEHEFRSLGWAAIGSALAAVIGSEVDRLDREAATLRKLRAGFVRYGVEGPFIAQPRRSVDVDQSIHLRKGG